MSQHDFDITASDANTGVAMRSAINAALQALAECSAGATEPSTAYPYQLWADTTNGFLKMRNAANNAWIVVTRLAGGGPGSTQAFATGALTVTGGINTTSSLTFSSVDSARTIISASTTTLAIAPTSAIYGGIDGAVGTNNVGGDLNLYAGLGTGNATPSNIAICGSTATTSGSTRHAAKVYALFQGTSNGLFVHNLAGGATTLSVDASGNIIRTPSDEKLKIDVTPLPYGMNEIKALTPVKHGWTTESGMGDGKSLGLIAQQVLPILPEVVSVGGEYLSVDYQKLVPVLIKAVQELEARVALLEVK